MKKIKILIADDENQIRDLFREHPLSAGFEIFEADSGSSAIRQVEANFPQIILSDIRMPEGTGIEFLRRLRHVEYPSDRFPADFRPQIYVMTGLIEQAESYLIALGARKVFCKPFDIGQTLTEIQKNWAEYRPENRTNQWDHKP